MTQYLTKFPVIPYDITGKRRTNYEFITNIFFRVHIIRKVLNNISSYYDYIVKDYQTPEFLADRVYGTPQAHWIILLANNIMNPWEEWPRDSKTFESYIISKYGSIENAQTTYHHYEKVISRTESLSNTETETRFRVNSEELTVNLASSLANTPYDTYESLTDVTSYAAHNLENGRTVIEIINRDAISNYDWEFDENEKKRSIKIIKPEYYPQIIDEFDRISKTKKPVYLRRFY